MKDGNTPITGLAIRTMGKQSYLFVATTLSVYLYNISVKDKETKSPLDNMGCEKKCSVLAETSQDSHFMIGRNDVSIFLRFIEVFPNFGLFRFFQVFMKKMKRNLSNCRRSIATLWTAVDRVTRSMAKK